MDENADPMNYIKRILLNAFRTFMYILGRIIRPLLGMLLFTVIAVLEMGDWTTLLTRYNDPSVDAALYGIATSEASTYLLIQIIFAIGIVLTSLVTVVCLFQDSQLAIKTSQLTGILYILYGAYQIYSSLSLLTKGEQGMILAGSVYIIIGLAVFGLGGKFLNKPRSQTNLVKRKAAGS
jgi:hypothetical protein